MTVNDTIRTPTKNVNLTKDGVTVGFNLSDPNGKTDRTNLLQSLNDRIGLKLVAGGTKHSRYVPPYASLEQRDWSGGRGLDNHEEDETRYYDGKYVNTWRQGKLFLAGQWSHSTGYRTDVNHNLWGDNYRWQAVYGTTRYYTVPFTTPVEYTTGTISVVARSVGSARALYYAIYSNVGGDPDTELESGFVELDSNAAQNLTIQLTEALSGSTTYHLVVYGKAADDEDNYIEVCYDTDDTGGATSSDMVSFDAADKFYYYISGTNTPQFHAHFFEYVGIPHVILDYDDNSAPKILMNGAFERLTGATSATVTVASAGWTVDEWAGWILALHDGTGSESLNRYYTIASNTADTITISSTFDVTPDTSTYIAIIGGDDWHEITGHGITSGPITDVLSTKNIAYIMRGDRNDAVSMRYPTLSTGAFTNLAGTRGTFMQVALDSDNLHKLWKADRGAASSVDKSYAPWGNYANQVGSLDWGYDAAVVNGDMELDASWSAVGAPTTEERSSEQAFSGTYSWKLVCDAANQGITQTLSLTANDFYRIAARVYLGSGAANGVKLMMGGTEIDSITATVKESWLYLDGIRQANSASETVQILSDTGATEFYVDDVYLRPLSTFVPVTGMTGRITGLIRYGEPERLWVLTSNGVYMESNGSLKAIPLQTMLNSTDDRNGVASVVHDVYLFFSFLEGVERYYKSNLDDMGANRDEGLPDTRRGAVVDMVSYPGRIYAAYDGGDNISSVMLYNELGWHEVYRAPYPGLRIRGLHLEPLPGDTVDRLWINVGRDIVYIPVDLNPLNNDNYKYCYEGYIESQSIYYGKHDIEKFFKELRLVTRNLTTSIPERTVIADYEIDGVGWVQIDTYDVSEFETHDLSSNNDVTGRRIRYRLRLRTNSPSETPEVYAVVLEFLEQVIAKESYTMQFLAEDGNISLIGVDARDRVETAINILKGWQDDPSPAAVYSEASLVNGKNVKVLSVTWKPLMISPEQQEEKLLVTIQLIEV